MIELHELRVMIIPVLLQLLEVSLRAAIIRHMLTLHNLIRLDLRQQQPRQPKILIQIRLTVDLPVLEVVLIVFLLLDR